MPPSLGWRTHVLSAPACPQQLCHYSLPGGHKQARKLSQAPGQQSGHYPWEWPVAIYWSRWVHIKQPPQHEPLSPPGTLATTPHRKAVWYSRVQPVKPPRCSCHPPGKRGKGKRSRDEPGIPGSDPALGLGLTPYKDRPILLISDLVSLFHDESPGLPAQYFWPEQINLMALLGISHAPSFAI